MAEWSKALDLGSSLSGGVGSNPTAISFCPQNGVWAVYFQTTPLWHSPYISPRFMNTLNGTGFYLSNCLLTHFKRIKSGVSHASSNCDVG